MKKTLLFSTATLVGLFSACSKNEEATVYESPKDEVTQAPPTRQMPFAGASQVSTPPQDMVSQSLSPEAVNSAGSNPHWNIPEGWEQGGGSSIRRASFSAPGSGGPVDIAVTSFPGDVGGLLANINRWRGQIGLSPLTASNLEPSIERLTIGDKEAILTRMQGPTDATHALIVEHEGQSWFFKMTGPTASVAEQAEAFASWIQSIHFHAS